MMRKSTGGVGRLTSTPHRLLPPATPNGSVMSTPMTGGGLASSMDGGGIATPTLEGERMELSTFATIYPFDVIDAKRDYSALSRCHRIPGLAKLGSSYEGMTVGRRGKVILPGQDEEDDDDDDDEEEEEEQQEKPVVEEPPKPQDDDDESDDDEDIFVTVGKKRKRTADVPDDLRRSGSLSESDTTTSPSDKDFVEEYGDFSLFREQQEDQVIEISKEGARKCMPLNMVLGLEDAKKLLIDNITKPLERPEAYRGSTPPQKFLCIWGKKGSGVSTLLRGFCKAMAMRLYVINAHMSKEGMMRTALNCSLQQPTVILLDRCDEMIGMTQKGTIGAELNYYYEQFKLRDHPVWIVFSLYNRPQSIQPRFYEQIQYHTVWANPPNAQARHRLFYRFIMHQCKHIGAHSMGKHQFQQLLTYMVRASYMRTPREIFDFVRRVFRNKQDSVPLDEMRKMGADCTRIVPTADDFENSVYGGADNPNIMPGDAAVEQSVYFDVQQNMARHNDPRYKRPPGTDGRKRNVPDYSQRFTQSNGGMEPPAKRRRHVDPFAQRPSLAKPDPTGKPLTQPLRSARPPTKIVPNESIRMSELKAPTNTVAVM